ncbi:hypothetical protein YC2023_040924 [Brassica napus]
MTTHGKSNVRTMKSFYAGCLNPDPYRKIPDPSKSNPDSNILTFKASASSLRMQRLQPLEHPPQAFVLLLQPPQPLFAYGSRIPPLVLLHTFNSSTFTKIKNTHKRDDEIVVICSSKKEEGIHYH